MHARIRTTLPIHPTLTHPDGSPVQALGVSHRTGRLIWPVRGGSADAGDAGGGAPAGDAPPADAPPAGDQPPAPPGTPPAPPAPPAGDLPTDPAALHQMIRDLRQENASARTTAKATAADEARTALAQEIGKALGLVQGDEPPDPAKLTEQLTATQAQARQAAVELAVFRAAGAHQGDPSALLDSRSFLTKVAELDPTAADFPAKVDAAIKDAVSTNPKLKTAQVAGASGADHAGGSGEQRNTGKPLPLAQAVSSHYGT